MDDVDKISTELVLPENPGIEYFESKQVYLDLASINSHFVQEFEAKRMTKLAKRLGYEGFTAIWNGLKKDVQLQKTGRVIDADNVSEFTGQPFAINTKQWRADDFGVWRYGNKGEEIEWACSHPIMPTSLLRGIDTKQMKVELWYRLGDDKSRPGEYVIVDMKDISSTTAIVNRLSSIGISVTSGPRANNLVDYLRDSIDASRDIVKEVKSISRMGWNDEGFSPYTSDLIFDGVEKFRKIYQSITQVGTMDAWLFEALDARSYSLPARIVLAASFASVLVEPLGCLPFFVHLWSTESGSGKTVTQMLAASVWAEPTPGGAFFPTFKGTDTGFELLAGFLHSLPLFLDDLQLKKDNRGRLAFNVYDLASGAGKLRANKELGINYTPEWKNCFITSGESPIVGNDDGAGAFNRVIEVGCEHNEHANQTGHRTANTLKENYGWAGKLFVEKLSENGNMDKAKQLYESYYAECIKSDTTGKQAMAASVILVADKLATEWIFKDGRELTASDIGKFLKESADVNINERGYSILCDWISENIRNFQQTEIGEDGKQHMSQIYGECYGVIEDMGTYTMVYINNKVFDRFCEENKLSSRGLLSHMKASGLIETKEKGYTKSKRVNNVPTNCVWLKVYEMQENLQNESEIEYL